MTLERSLEMRYRGVSFTNVKRELSPETKAPSLQLTLTELASPG